MQDRQTAPSDQKSIYQDIEALLASGHTVQLTPQGTSMYPMFADARDQAVIAPLGDQQPERGDVVLYRREPSAGGMLVLHRVLRRTAAGYDMVGDNQSEVEHGVRQEQLRGILVAWERRGKMRSVRNIGYRVFAALWLWMLPLRTPIHRLLGRLRSLGG